MKFDIFIKYINFQSQRAMKHREEKKKGFCVNHAPLGQEN